MLAYRGASRKLNLRFSLSENHTTRPRELRFNIKVSYFIIRNSAYFMTHNAKAMEYFGMPKSQETFQFCKISQRQRQTLANSGHDLASKHRRFCSPANRPRLTRCSGYLFTFFLFLL